MGNLEVAYLLQRMESYEGVSLLTTNVRDALDPAFARRSTRCGRGEQRRGHPQ